MLVLLQTWDYVDESSNKVYGIAPYTAPEILHGNKNTDIYSIGMLMWEMWNDDRAHD